MDEQKLEEVVTELRARVARLEARVAELERQPSAESVLQLHEDREARDRRRG